MFPARTIPPSSGGADFFSHSLDFTQPFAAADCTCFLGICPTLVRVGKKILDCPSWLVNPWAPHHVCRRLQQGSYLACSLALGGPSLPARDQIHQRLVLACTRSPFLQCPIRLRFPTQTCPILFTLRNEDVFVCCLVFFSLKTNLYYIVSFIVLSFEYHCRYRLVGRGRERFIRFDIHTHRSPLQTPIDVAHTHVPCFSPKNWICRSPG